MLHWFFYFLFLFMVIILGFMFYNNSLMHLLVLSEAMIVMFMCLMSSLALYFNLYYLMGLSILLLMFGGLELSINLLFLISKC